ncbi:MAG: hypothetical protein LBR65_05290 [Culturomica sp.]|jgi:prophage antirepressor-like protein|nr:hypothetical protein [Culturomica sp.]
MENKIQLFHPHQVRSVWDGEQGKWWLSVVDICAVLTESDYQTARKYWKVLKGRLVTEGNEVVTNCYQLKMLAPDGKMRLTNAKQLGKRNESNKLSEHDSQENEA